jgi:hypothetical protein
VRWGLEKIFGERLVLHIDGDVSTKEYVRRLVGFGHLIDDDAEYIFVY